MQKSPMAFEMTMPCTQARPAAKHICNLGCRDLSNPSYLSRTGRLRVNITLVFGGWILELATPRTKRDHIPKKVITHKDPTAYLGASGMRNLKNRPAPSRQP